MVKLSGIARARAMTVLEKVIGEYDGKLTDIVVEYAEYRRRKGGVKRTSSVVMIRRMAT